jgi:cytochrome c oxidase subunit 4
VNDLHAVRAEGAHPAPHPAAPHVLSPGVLLGTAGALFALTALTVVTSKIQLGPFNIVLALAIAGLKATLVALFFMHLRWENRFQAVVIAAAVFFAVLLVGFVVFDTTQYQPGIRAAAEAEQGTR